MVLIGDPSDDGDDESRSQDDRYGAAGPSPLRDQIAPATSPAAPGLGCQASLK